MGTESNFIIRDNEPEMREFNGIIEDISEGGIRIRVTNEQFKDAVSTIKEGSVITFQSYDEYKLYQELRQEVFMGEVEVLRVDKSATEMVFGCKFVRLTKDLEEYIKNKKVSVFIANNCKAF